MWSRSVRTPSAIWRASGAGFRKHLAQLRSRIQRVQAPKEDIGIPVAGGERQTVAKFRLQLAVSKRCTAIAARHIAPFAQDGSIGQCHLECGVRVIEVRAAEWRRG